MIKIISVLFFIAAITGCSTSKSKTKLPVGDWKFINKAYANGNNQYHCPYSSLDEVHRNIYHSEKNH